MYKGIFKFFGWVLSAVVAESVLRVIGLRVVSKRPEEVSERHMSTESD